ncbi:SPOR domain-containing protein [uncultured Phenylobacterium sp.]|uniref:SPOR domain-containing protein n=1 Tax=uncultured Phenylobacterium sp. TaxID=349273 RepID=UPI0025FC82DA|nr:SPOR domain-containing protein [uncultured Phenylobacterium sp.]
MIGAAGLAGTPGLSQPLPSFPSSLDREPLLAWLRRETDIQAERVVAVTPQAVTSVVSTFPAAGGQGPRVVLRAEALSGETYARTGALSWHVSLNADCRDRRVRMGETTGYPQRNLLGERRVLRAAETEWRAPGPGTALDNAWRAACEPHFQGPFASANVTLAQNEVAAPAPPEPPPAAPTSVPNAPAPEARGAPVADPPRRAAAQKAASGGAVTVQIGAFPDVASAQAALARLGDERPHAIEAAVVGGRTWRRAVVGGFESVEAGERYCVQRKAQGGSCFVRVRAR